jgi:hypothetical protein
MLFHDFDVIVLYIQWILRINFLRVLPASSTTKTSRHDRAEILVKVAISTINQVKSSNENELKYIELRRIIVINEMTKLMRNELPSDSLV